MKTKRVKINFDTVNEGMYEIIDPKDIAETNRKVKEHMKQFKKDQKITWKDSKTKDGKGEPSTFLLDEICCYPHNEVLEWGVVKNKENEQDS